MNECMRVVFSWTNLSFPDTLGTAITCSLVLVNFMHPVFYQFVAITADLLNDPDHPVDDVECSGFDPPGSFNLLHFADVIQEEVSQR